MGLGLLHTILAEHQLTGRQGGIDSRCGLGLADRHQRDVVGFAPGARGRSGDAITGLFQAHPNITFDIGVNSSFT